MTKEIAKKQETEVATVDMSKYVQDAPKLESLTTHIVIPRISMAQKMSPAVDEGKCKSGEFYDFGAEQAITAVGGSLNFIPLFVRMVKPEQRLDGKDWEYTGVVKPVTAKNQKDPWEYEIAGVPHRAKPQLQVYMMLPSQLENVLEALPYLFTFNGSSMKKGGNTLYTNLLITQATAPSFSKIFSMKGVLEKNDKGSFYEVHVDQVTTPVPPKFLDVLHKWSVDLSKLSDIRILGEDDLREPEHKAPQAPVTDEDLSF